MSRTRVVAALSGLLGMVAAVVVAVPASAAPAGGTGTIDFADGTLGSWSQNGSPTLAYVPDPDDASNQVLSVSGRTSGYFGIQSAVGAFDEGVTYTVTARVRTAGVDGAAHFTFNEPGASNEYSWVGNTATGTASAWKIVTGTFTPGAGASTAKIYFEVEGLVDYLVDDIVVTGDAGEPEPCVPATSTHTSVDFEDGTLGAWSANGSPSLAYVADPDDAGNQVLSVSGRTSGYFGIQSAVGAFDEGVTYTITAKVRTNAFNGAAHFTYNEPGAANEYSWVGNTATGTDSTWKVVTGTFTPGAGADSAKIYLEVEGLLDYYADDIVVTYLGTCDSGPEPGTVAISTDFEDGLGGWTARDSGAGAPTVAVTTADAHGGAQAALVSDRLSQGAGLRYDVTDVMVAGATYELTAWVKFAGSPVDDLWLSMEAITDGTSSFSTLAQFTGVTNGEWTQVTASFAMPPADQAFIYFETPYEGGDTGNTTSFMVDDVLVVVPEPPVVQDLTPIKNTVDFPVGVAIDQRETTGAPSDLLLKHFSQITPENFMKPEAWYDAEGNWSPNTAQIDSLMDFAKANDIRVYGHVLVWHSQTPAWFFQDAEGNPLTTSEADKQVLRDRMREHIHNVAEYLSQWGEFGDGNPLVAFDVVNEVIDDSSAYADGMRRSEWYRILGEEFVADAFTYADEAFNGTYAAESADRPVTLFINDYNTEQSGKRSRYLALIDRLLAADVPVDGIGHQFHLSLSQPVATLDEALTDASTRGLLQAVTELDVTTGTPESAAKFIDQGYYYRDAFEIFRAHSEQMFSVTVWGLNDARSWRDSSGGPLVFDDGFQAKPAYYGIVEPSGMEEPLPARLRTANSFAGDVPATAAGVASAQWGLLPLLPAGDSAGFQTRWATDHLSVYVDVDDATLDAGDAVTVQIGDDNVTLPRSGGAAGAVVERSGGYSAVVHVPLVDAAEGGTVQLDVRVTDDDATTGWNTSGVTGTVTLVEALSQVDIPEAAVVPTIDGTSDPVWSTSTSVQTLKQVSGTGGAIGTFNLLWKGQTLYVLAEVADPTVDVSGSDPWTQDSVEIYVDGGNAKNGSYRYDDTQIRINADNTVSFGTGDETFQANRVDSAATRVEGGYVIEAAISLLEYGGLGTVQGLDVQVNDASGGARTAIRNWADPTGAGYQSTARWGVATLVEGTLITQPAFTPSINGTAVVGKKLSVSGLPTGTTLSYQWLRNGAVITGATGATYTVATADAGKRLSVRVTSVAPGSFDRVATSALTAVVLKVFTTTTKPTITGTSKVGVKLTAKVAQWSPTATFRYQWNRDGKPISGATKSTYTPTRYDAGHRLTVSVTGSRTGYASVTTTSSARSIPLMTLTVDAPRLNGPTHVGGTLRVTAGQSHPVAAVVTYQWYRNGVKVAGATKSTYTLPSSSVGARYTVKLTYKAWGFAAKTVTAGPTYRIAAR